MTGSGPSSHKRLRIIAEEVAAIAGIGLTFNREPYDRQRYERLRSLSAEMMAALSGAPPGVIEDWLRLDTGYVTPKTDVRAIVLREGRVLLAREKSDGRWSAPGGWTDLGESAAEAVEKEVREETGLTVRAVRLLAHLSMRRVPDAVHVPHVYKIFFLCEETGGSLLAETLETQGAAFFALDALPPLSLYRVTPEMLTRMAGLATAPPAPAEFGVA